ncbi:hypothetical protein [Phenylobacterium sp.]|jgi:hypothetical protein|uniref:hypothetical protein n=1 Tax=Phenylobacterium sp. TaxID=1871053 RepID=UPI002F932DF5
MQPSRLEVKREGRRWGVAADGETLATAPTKREAENLAREAAEILSASGALSRVDLPPEPRSFKED